MPINDVDIGAPVAVTVQDKWRIAGNQFMVSRDAGEIVISATRFRIRVDTATGKLLQPISDSPTEAITIPESALSAGQITALGQIVTLIRNAP